MKGGTDRLFWYYFVSVVGFNNFSWGEYSVLPSKLSQKGYI